MKANILHMIDKNDGSIPRGYFGAQLQKLYGEGLIDTQFKSAQPKYIPDHIHYDFVLTDKGRQYLKDAKGKLDTQVVSVIKEKNGRPTVIEVGGYRYILQPQPMGRGKK